MKKTMVRFQAAQSLASQLKSTNNDLLTREEGTGFIVSAFQLLV
jgi:hypothetical protein